jgi:hypothetical protein
MMQPVTAEHGLLAPWRQVLEERVRQAVEALAQIPGVLGLILCGSVGRGEAWPLSDIDMIPIYEDGQVKRAAGEVEVRRLEFLDWWVPEGLCTSLDVGKLRFSRSEAEQAVGLPPGAATRYLDEPRWFHSLDKGYRGRAAFDPEGLASALARWLTDARFAPEVVRGRLETHWRQAQERYAQARQTLEVGDALAAAIGLRESLHAIMRYLMERWGGQDNSWARFGTRFERKGIERGEGELVAEIMALYGLAPDEVGRRMALAPHGVRYRHRISLEARRLVGETVTDGEDARDVLLVFSTQHVRYGRPPLEAWVGLESNPAVLGGQIDEYGRLLERLKAS